MFRSTFPVYCFGSRDPLLEVVPPPVWMNTWSPPKMEAFTTRHSATGVMSIIPLARPLWQRHTQGVTRWHAHQSASVCCHMMQIVSHFCCRAVEVVHWQRFTLTMTVVFSSPVCILVLSCFWMWDFSIYDSDCTVLWLHSRSSSAK